MPTIQFKGKTFVQNHHLAVKYHQLVPKKELSLTDKISLHDNLIIEGDNLRALKSLLPTYAGKIKCIYIDPPYNTGTDNGKWVYNDNVSSPMMQDWLGSIVDAEDLTRHDKWLCMMLPRLKLLRELLSENGYIFISIDDHELCSLKTIMDEIFGKSNYIEIFAWTKTSTPPSLASKSRKTTEYVICYQNTKDSSKLRGESLSGGDQPLLNSGNALRELKFPKEIVKFNKDGVYKKGTYDRVTLKTDIKVSGGKANKDFVLEGEYKWGDDFFQNEIKDGTTFIIKSEKFAIRFIRKDDDGHKAPNNLFKEKYFSNIIDKPNTEVGTNETASAELEDLFGKKVFDFPKPMTLIKYLISLCTEEDDIILDSFAGSGTTAHAVLQLNKEDEGNRKFILVQWKELNRENTLIDITNDVTAERTRRVINGVPKSKNFKKGTGGTFSYFELGPTIEMESILQGKNLPSYKEFARYIFYTATGEEFNEKKIQFLPPLEGEKEGGMGFIGETKNYELYMFYKPDVEWLKRNALTLDGVKAMPKFNGKQRLVFAPAKYVDDYTCLENRIDFCQLPYEIYRIQK
ncbi:MAG: site-specific DNA-methyltransferase [Ferruginibacter sp.]